MRPCCTSSVWPRVWIRWCWEIRRSRASSRARGSRPRRWGSTSQFLDAVLQKALTVAKRVHNETAISHPAVSVPYAAADLARQTLGSLEHKRVLVLGAGQMSELAARYLVNHGAGSVC